MNEKNEILQEITQRSSAEFYINKKIDRNILNRILEAGRLAPSAKNRQAWRFIVIDKDELIKEIKGAAYQLSIVGESAAVVAVCTTNIEYMMPNRQLSYPIDLSFATAFMMLQAEKEGVSSRVITTYDEEEIKEVLNVPHSMKVVMLLTLGYTEEEKERQQADRKELKSISSFNHW
ncbi:MAG: nitroreductase family protein [Spirochaetales bacterium]|nr:nitroreductase family protein [Spirochaetales bacterium]